MTAIVFIQVEVFVLPAATTAEGSPSGTDSVSEKMTGTSSGSKAVDAELGSTANDSPGPSAADSQLDKRDKANVSATLTRYCG